MSVRFKFRSSPNYDSVDIGGQPSISVRDLKSRIVKSKNLNLCQDFDLLFCDPISGQEYEDDDFQIPRGSSVIIKRVPAGARVGSLEDVAPRNTNISKTSYPENVETINFDDFGAELCCVPEADISEFVLDTGNKFCFADKETNKELKSCSEQPAVECHKFEASDVSEAVPQGQNASDTKLRAEIELNSKLSSFPAMQAVNFPSEMKCSLCSTSFKEAVMIPCCQHSFCEKCICHVLVEKARCPKCFSTKCKVEDLLPNVSLRQAVERFLKSQILINGSENALHEDAPDEESGIQVKDVSCPVSVLPRGAELAPCSSATGMGSNQVPAESVAGTASQVNVNHLGRDKISKFPVHKLQQLPGDVEGFADFQGENQPLTDEAESIIKNKRALWVNTADADKNFVHTGRLKKMGDRACYICGSLGHLRRDCPGVFSPHSMLQRGNGMFQGAMPGYVSPYWNGPPFPNVRPFANPYGNSGIMPFNVSMVPNAPFPVPAYVPSMFGGSPAFGGFTRMGGIVAAGRTNVDQLFHPELGVQDYDKRYQFMSENVARNCYDGDDVKRRQCEEAEGPFDKRSYPDRERSASYGEDTFTNKSLLKHWQTDTDDDDAHSDDETHDKIPPVATQNLRPYHHSERSRSEVDDMPSSSSWHTEERCRHVHGRSKRRNDRQVHCDSDCSWSHFPNNEEKDVQRKTVKHDAERRHRKQYSHSESSLKSNHSSDRKKKRRGKDSSQSTRPSEQKSKSAHDDLSHDRWQMASRSRKDNQEEYHCYKRKKVYQNNRQV